VGYFQAIRERAATWDETLIGRSSLAPALESIGQYGNPGCKFNVREAWFGINIQLAIREDEQGAFAQIKQMFKTVLLEMNVDHPWTTEQIGQKQITRIIDYDYSWTLEDFAVFFDMAAGGQLANHYGRPSRQWWEDCQRKYNELKFEAREEIARRAKVKAEADAMEAAYNAGLRLPTSEEHMQPARTMAEFLGGKSKLSFAEREAMKQRDQQRNG
jgi:hypothetical protein